MIAAIFLLAFVLVTQIFILIASFPLVKWWIGQIFNADQQPSSQRVWLIAASLFSIGYLASLSLEPSLTAFRLTNGNWGETLKLTFFFLLLAILSAILIQWLLLFVLRRNPQWARPEEAPVLWATFVVLLALAIHTPLLRVFEALLPYPHIPGIN
jgi:hypothetical protein